MISDIIPPQVGNSEFSPADYKANGLHHSLQCKFSSAQGLVDSLNRLPLVVPEKMFDIFEHEGLRARLCEYSLDLKEQGTLRFVHEPVRSIQAILFRDTGD
jgi:hypothetical protein